jgi:cation transport ATPase
VVEDNWASQLKKIEREFDGLPPEPSPAVQKMQSEAERRAKEKAQQRAAMFGAGARLILVFALAAAIVVWPYSRECGWGWFGFVGVEAVIVAGGLWVAFTTWRGRLPKMHAFSLLIVLAGLVLIAAEVLPRIGYAATDPKHPPQLWCPETTSPPPAVTMISPHQAITMTNALPDTTVLEQRVRFATQSLGSRWKESTSDLARQLRPHQAALEQTLHRELRLRREP